MNEITRIHIAKTPYDIEVSAKKELEKYIKSLELYTQDADVLADIEIRITELLAEQGVVGGSVISSKDVTAVRTKLGEPYEFANDETDITVGPEATTTSRRFYRSLDDAVLGGVLSGLAAFLKINPLWVRLGFVIVLFVSFGFASFIYLLLWIITPAARTATEKLQLAGKEVTVESIRALNAAEEGSSANTVAPAIQRMITIALGAVSLLGAVLVSIGAIGLLTAVVTSNESFLDGMNNFVGMGAENTWIVWLVLGIVVFGLLLLASLLSLIAYGFFAKKATKRMIVSAVIITILGIASATAAIGISASQSWRVSSETQSMMRETSAKLPANFTDVTTVNFAMKGQKNNDQTFSSAYPLIRYIVDDGPVRYELNALPTTKTAVTVEGASATVEIDIPESYRNAYVQPTLTVYGPALQAIKSTASLRLYYSGNTQSLVTIQSGIGSNISVDGSYETVEVQGSGSVDLGSSAIANLRVIANQNLSAVAGTVRTLNVTQPDVCSSNTYKENTSVTVNGVTSGEIIYNGTVLPVESHQTSCAVINIESDDENATI